MAKHKGKPNNQNRQPQKDAAHKFRPPEAAKSRHAGERQRQEASPVQVAKVRETPKIPWPAPRQPTETRENYRFLNPYNFVRYLPKPAIPLAMSMLSCSVAVHHRPMIATLA